MAQNQAARFHSPWHIPIASPSSKARIHDKATSQRPFLRRGLSAYAKTSLADGTALDGSEVETKNLGNATFLTALSTRDLQRGSHEEISYRIRDLGCTRILCNVLICLAIW